ncbi:hypothetical protein TNIN_5531 [Trichonephila inaurata madagascariensis]|uniref:Uncharacterized protein n=1 Tax=Trichonephila inaurata madagascariensis TaxID=2747483 RepID=A0A8X7CNA6_9ARAC|nr:hypothetical protein TNIN_5531 [Trichonephila inaurata madagascariensis]
MNRFGKGKELKTRLPAFFSEGNQFEIGKELRTQCFWFSKRGESVWNWKIICIVAVFFPEKNLCILVFKFFVQLSE